MMHDVPRPKDRYVSPKLKSFNDKKSETLSTDGPSCAIHHLPLVFTPDEGAWLCSVSGCGMKAWPPVITGTDEPPVLGHGSLNVLFDERSKRMWLRSENNVMIEVTNYIWNSGVRDSALRLDMRFMAGDMIVIEG